MGMPERQKKLTMRLLATVVAYSDKDNQFSNTKSIINCSKLDF